MDEASQLVESISPQDIIAACRQGTQQAVHHELKSLVQLPEILFNIIEDVVASYVDLCFTAQKPFGCDTISTGTGAEHEEDPAFELACELPMNFVLPLVFVSYSFRDITYEILAKTLAIERRSDGSLARNPWIMMENARRAFHLALLRPLTLNDMPELKTFSTPTLIIVYLELASCDFFLHTARCTLMTLPIDHVTNYEESVSMAVRASSFLSYHFEDRISQRVAKLRPQMSHIYHLSVHFHYLLTLFELLQTRRHAVIEKELLDTIEEKVDIFMKCRYCNSIRYSIQQDNHPVLTRNPLVLTGFADHLTLISNSIGSPSFKKKLLDLLDLWSNLTPDKECLYPVQVDPRIRIIRVYRDN